MYVEDYNRLAAPFLAKLCGLVTSLVVGGAD